MVDSKLIGGIVLLIVGIVIIFNIVGETSSNLVSGSESVAYNCSLASEWYNATDGYCYYENTSQYDATTPAGTDHLPLSALFRPTSVLMIVLMAGILLTIVMLVLRQVKYKR